MANAEISNTGYNLLVIKQENENEKSILIQQIDHLTPLKDVTSHEHLKDVTIKAGERLFRAHKVILANSIGYFDEEFRKTNTNETIIIKDVNPEAMNSFITYAYTGKIEVTENDVFSILKSAVILKTDRIFNSCKTFLITLMRDNFEDISLKNDYLDLDFEILKSVLSSTELKASTQSIFNGVMRWFTHDYEQRNIYVPNLLCLFELSELSSEDIDNYLFQEASDGIGYKYKELVFELHSRRYQSIQQKRLTSSKLEPLEFRTNNGLTEYLNNRGENLDNDIDYQSSGGCSRNKVPNNTMTKVSSTIINGLQDKKSIHNIMKDELILNDDMKIENNLDETSLDYEVGNSSREQSENEAHNKNGLKEGTEQRANKKIFVISLEQPRIIETYDPETNAWTSIQIVENGIRNYTYDERSKNDNTLKWFSCTERNGKLYRFGGLKTTKKSETHFSNVEVFKPGKNTWKELARMITARRESGAVSLKNSLYVCGGWTGNETTNTVERYCFKSKKWELISSMKERRCTPAVIVFEDRIYAIGGAGPGSGPEDVYSDTIEVYDLIKKEWSILEARMETKRSSCGAAVLNGNIYVCGGWNGKIALNVVEMFDPKLNKWTSVESMNKGRKQFLVVAYSGKLWALGGARNGAWVEVYDPSEKRWTCVDERRGFNTNFYVTGCLL